MASKMIERAIRLLWAFYRAPLGTLAYIVALVLRREAGGQPKRA